jgi:hypothetical protein
VDETTQSLRAIIQKKKKVRRDLVRTPDSADSRDSDEHADIDLLAAIRQSLRQSSNNGAPRSSRAPASSNGAQVRKKRNHARRR